MESPSVHAPEGSPVLHGGGLWALTQAGGGTSYHPTIGEVVPVLQAAAGSGIPQHQSLSPVMPEASSIVVEVVDAFGQGSLVPIHPLTPALLRMILAENGVGRGHIPVRFSS